MNIKEITVCMYGSAPSSPLPSLFVYYPLCKLTYTVKTATGCSQVTFLNNDFECRLEKVDEKRIGTVQGEAEMRKRRRE